MAKKSSKPVSTPAPAEPTFKGASPVTDDDGNSLWDVFSLVPWVKPPKEPTTLVHGVTLDVAFDVMLKAQASVGCCPLVLWPSWAFLPYEWDMDNETIYMDLQNERLTQMVEAKDVSLDAENDTRFADLADVVSNLWPLLQHTLKDKKRKSKQHSTVSGRVMPKGIA